MFNIKVFPDFIANRHDEERELGILEMLAEVRKNTGASYVNVSILNHEGSKTEAIHFLTYPLGWISHYILNFYTDIDPLFQIDFRTISIVDWRDIFRTDEQKQLLRQFQAHDLGREGVTIVHPIDGETYCVLSLTFDHRKDWTHFRNTHLKNFRLQAQFAGDAYRQNYQQDVPGKFKITQRESECLYWVAMGKTDDQISKLLNIGKWTVTGHLQSVKYKLGTATRSAAVAQAIVTGIISVKNVS